MSSEQLKVLEDARGELRKQLFHEAETIVTSSRIARKTRAKIVEIQAAIDALDKAIASTPADRSIVPPGTSPLEQFHSPPSSTWEEADRTNPDRP
jgi:hypothetical protein